MIKVLLFLTSIYGSLYVSHSPAVSFYLREKGIKRCPTGSEVTDTHECKEACTGLGIRLSNNFKNGKPCFKAGNGFCKQGGSFGSKTSLICKQLGKVIYLESYLGNIKP